MHDHGLATSADSEKARSLYLKAAEAGDAEGQYFLAMFCMRHGDLQESVRWNVKAAAQSHVSASYWCYRMYERGEGVQQDHRKANEYLVQAMKLGNVFAVRERAYQLLRGQAGLKGIAQGAIMLAKLGLLVLRIAYRDPNDVRLLQ